MSSELITAKQVEDSLDAVKTARSSMWAREREFEETLNRYVAQLTPELIPGVERSIMKAEANQLAQSYADGAGYEICEDTNGKFLFWEPSTC